MLPLLLLLSGLAEGGEPATPIIAHTNDEGRFHFAGLTPGIYDLVADKLGFRKEDRKNIKLSEGESVELPTITLQVGHTDCGPSPSLLPDVWRQRLPARGTLASGLLAGADRSFEGGSIRLTNVRDSRMVFSTTTDSLGVFALWGVPPGYYRLRASKRGYASFVIDHPPIRVSQDKQTFVEVLPMRKCAGKRSCGEDRRITRIHICM